MKPSRVAMLVLAALLVLAASACGGSGSKQASSKTFDMQTVEGCFISDQNVDEMPQEGWFDLVNLGDQARNQGQGAFSTFPGSQFDTASYYFFNSHDQALQMLKRADRKAHDPYHVFVVGNVVAVDYDNLSGAEKHLQDRCLS